MSLLVGGGFVLVGPLFLGIGIGQARRLIRIPGRIVGYEKRTQTDNTGSITREHPIYEFADSKGTRQVTSAAGFIRPYLKVGTPIELHYDPKNPDAVQPAAFTNWGCFLLMGLLVTVVGLLVLSIALLADNWA